MTRRSEITHRARQLELDNEEEMEIIHLLVAENAKANGKTVKEISTELPPDSLLVSIKRDDRRLIPHGDTVIASGDHVSLIQSKREVEAIYKLFH